MKFYKRGQNISALKTSVASKNTEPSNYMHFITECDAEKVKWNDPEDKDAVNLVVRWKVGLKHDNGFEVWFIELKEHYGIKDKEVIPTNGELTNLIKDSYLSFRDYLEKQGEETDIILTSLDSSAISEILPKLLEAYNSQI